MATTFKNVVVANVGTERTEIIATNDNARVTVVGFSLANTTNGTVLVDVELQDEDSVRGYYAKEIVIPPNTSLRVLNGGEKLILLKKKAFDYMVSKYLDKFPDYWTPDSMYSFNLKELVEYISKFQEKLETLKTEMIEFQNFKNDYYYIKDIKKMLKFNY